MADINQIAQALLQSMQPAMSQVNQGGQAPIDLGRITVNPAVQNISSILGNVGQGVSNYDPTMRAISQIIANATSQTPQGERNSFAGSLGQATGAAVRAPGEFLGQIFNQPGQVATNVLSNPSVRDFIGRAVGQPSSNFTPQQIGQSQTINEGINAGAKSQADFNEIPTNPPQPDEGKKDSKLVKFMKEMGVPLAGVAAGIAGYASGNEGLLAGATGFEQGYVSQLLKSREPDDNKLETLTKMFEVSEKANDVALINKGTTNPSSLTEMEKARLTKLGYWNEKKDTVKELPTLTQDKRKYYEDISGGWFKDNKEAKYVLDQDIVAQTLNSPFMMSLPQEVRDAYSALDNNKKRAKYLLQLHKKFNQ